MKPRLQFRLRTLLIVVTVLAVACEYIAAQAKTVRDRMAMRDAILDRVRGPTIDDHEFLVRDNHPDRIPWVRRLFGDVPYAHIELPRSAGRDCRRRVREIFPEAEITGYWCEVIGEVRRALFLDEYEEPPR